MRAATLQRRRPHGTGSSPPPQRNPRTRETALSRVRGVPHTARKAPAFRAAPQRAKAQLSRGVNPVNASRLRWTLTLKDRLIVPRRKAVRRVIASGSFETQPRYVRQYGEKRTAT